jgi:hypothetical protein
MRHVFVAIGLVLALAVPAIGQSAAAPDFSGTWVLNVAKSTLAKGDTIKSETLVIQQKGSAIVFHYRTNGKKSTEKYIPDGQPRSKKVTSSSQLISATRWQGSTLVIESTLQISIPNAVISVSGLKPVVDKWSLGSDGQTLFYNEDSGKEILVYDRQ